MGRIARPQTSDMDQTESMGLAVGYGALALEYLTQSQERMDDFELWAVSYTDHMPDYSQGKSVAGALNCAKHLCVHLSRMLGVKA